MSVVEKALSRLFEVAVFGIGESSPDQILPAEGAAAQPSALRVHASSLIREQHRTTPQCQETGNITPYLYTPDKNTYIVKYMYTGPTVIQNNTFMGVVLKENNPQWKSH